MRISRLEAELLRGARGPFLGTSEAGGGAGAGTQDNANAGGQQGGGAAAPVFTAEQNEAIGKLLKKEREDTERRVRDTVKQEQDRDRQKADSDRQAAEQAAKGEFEAAKATLTTRAEGAEQERDRLKAENDQLRAAMNAGLEAGWKALPEEVRKIGEKSHPDTDVIGRWTFLHDPDTAALVKKITGEEAAPAGARANPAGAGAAGLSGLTPEKVRADYFKARGLPPRS